MIRFFRSIRQKLLRENRFTRYLIYAAGEVLLVVIGILIALAINNWNEEQKLRKLEITLLQEMQENLRSDIQDMQENVRFHELSLNSAEMILLAFDQQLPEHDTLHTHFGRIAVVPKFLVTMNAYDSMKNIGMRLVQNDSLRNAITNHYQRNYAYILSWNASEWDGLFRDQQAVYRQHFEEFKYIRKAVPVDYEALSSDQKFRNFLQNRIGFLEPTIRYYNFFGIEHAEGVIEMIEKELESRDGE